MNQHYFIGISAPSSLEHQMNIFRDRYRLAEHYKVMPHVADLHITLRYIGELDGAQLPMLNQSLQDVSKNYAPFDITVTNLSYFGSPTGPRVVYLATDSPEPLHQLYQDISQQLEEHHQMKKEDRFVPHITIAKKRKTRDKLQIDKELMTPPQTFPVIGFSLFTIHPAKSPKYEVVSTFPFIKKS